MKTGLEGKTHDELDRLHKASRAMMRATEARQGDTHVWHWRIAARVLGSSVYAERARRYFQKRVDEGLR